MTAANLRHAEYERDVFDVDRHTGFGSAVVVPGLGTAGALSGGSMAKVLSRLAAAVTGCRRSARRPCPASSRP